MAAVLFRRESHLLEEVSMAARLDAKQKTHVVGAQILNMWRIGAEGVFDENDFEMRMFAAKMLQSPSGGTAFAIIFRAAVLLDDGFGTKRNDFLMIGMNQSQTKHLMIVGDHAIAAFLFQTTRTVDLFGRVIGCAIAKRRMIRAPCRAAAGEKCW